MRILPACLIATLVLGTPLALSAEEGGERKEARKEVEVKKEGHDAMAEGTKGVSEGTIVSLEKGKLVLATQEGNLAFTPHWTGGMPKDGGGFDKDMMRTLEGFRPGQKVSIAWTWSERRRIERITAK